MKKVMTTIRTTISKIQMQTYFFILGLTLFNLGIFLFSLDLGLITTGLTLVMLAVIINIEKER